MPAALQHTATTLPDSVFEIRNILIQVLVVHGLEEALLKRKGLTYVAT